MSNDSSTLRLKYEREYDLLSVWIGAPRPVETVEVETGVCVRVDAKGQVVGLEVVDAAARLGKDPSVFENAAFVRGLMDRYGRTALSAFSPAPAR